jgi:hypothetical protein
MVERDVLARLVDLLQDENTDVPRSSINVITALAKFGKLIYYFLPCED